MPSTLPLTNAAPQNLGVFFGAPFFRPPYESQMAEDFAWNVGKYLADAANLQTKVLLQTPAGPLALDFMLSHQNRRIGVLLNGDATVQENAQIAFVLSKGWLEAVYRLNGSDLFYHLSDVLYLLSCLQSSFFSERGKINLTRLASEQAKKLTWQVQTERFLIDYKKQKLSLQEEVESEGFDGVEEEGLNPLLDPMRPFAELQRFNRLTMRLPLQPSASKPYFNAA